MSHQQAGICEKSVDEESLPHPNPIYQVFKSRHEAIGAAYTGKGSTDRNLHFSFQRPPSSDPANVSKHFRANLQTLAHRYGFDAQKVALPNGAWPHSGRAITAEDYSWIECTRSGTIMPVGTGGEVVTYDAIVTRSAEYVLAAQGADCPQIFFFDPTSKVIGAAHAGWKPLVRGVVQNTVQAMISCGARAQNILAYISPGAGDEYNVFHWDEQMESHIRQVFLDANRSDLLNDPSIRYRLTSEDRTKLSTVLGRDVPVGATSFGLYHLATVELERCGLLPQHISSNIGSTIVDRYPLGPGDTQPRFKYHSYRREKPNHGLSIGILFLRCGRRSSSHSEK